MQSRRFAPFSPACDDTKLERLFTPPHHRSPPLPGCNIDWLKVPRTMCGISRGLQVRRNCWFAWLLRGLVCARDGLRGRCLRWCVTGRAAGRCCHLLNSPTQWDSVCTYSLLACVLHQLPSWSATGGPGDDLRSHSCLHRVTTAIVCWQNLVCGYLTPLLSLTPAVLATRLSVRDSQPISNADTRCMLVFIKHCSGWSDIAS